MITVVGHVLCQLKTGQQSMRIPEVDMVDPSPSNVSGPRHKLLEAKATEGCGEETVGMLVQADVHVPRDGCHFLHVDKLFQVVHQLLLTSIVGPVDGGYLMVDIFVRYC